MESVRSRIVALAGRRARLQLARALWVSSAILVAGGAILFTFYLSSFGDSTRAASDLAELRTYAQRVALAANMSVDGDGAEMLEESIVEAELRTAGLSDYLSRVFADGEADGMLTEVKDAWATTAETARQFADGDAEFENVVAAADETGIAVDELLSALAARSESRTDQFRLVLQASVLLLVMGGILSASALLRQRRRVREMDALTGVLSRDRFREQLAFELLNQRGASNLAVAVVDIDRFRRINQTLGAEQGDRVLRDVARRIQDALPRGACVGRRGGDEFLLMLPDQDAEGSRDIARGILAALDRPLAYQSGELRAGVSIGLALAPHDGSNAAALLSAADVARDGAKADGGGTYRFADRGASTPEEDTLALEVELRHALENEEFELFYQPQIDVESGDIVGAEALLRWRSPQRGLVSPDRFIPLLEESRLIVPVGNWAIRRAAQQAREWIDLRDEPFRIAVNVSARQLFQSDLVAAVRGALAESGLPAENLELEVTETVAIQSPDEAVRVLEEIADLGVLSSLDDFGTGHSWLNHLKLLPKMSLKIDRSFVSGITENAEDRAIVAGLVTVAHTLQRTVVAEGVERASQLALLEEMHCDVAQGYYFSRPVPAEDFETLLLRDLPWAPRRALVAA